MIKYIREKEKWGVLFGFPLCITRKDKDTV